MQEQRDSVKQPDVLSWQYVVLMVAIALLVVLIAAVPVDIQRAAPPTETPQVAAVQPTVQPPTAVPTQAGTAEPTVEPTPIPVAPLTDANFDQHFEDGSGITFDYPTGWYTGLLQADYVLLTNFPQDVEALPDNWAIIGVQIGAVSDIAAADGTVQAPGTSPHDLVQILLDSNELTDLEIQEVTIDGKPAARVQVVTPDREFAFVLITPNENAIVTIRGEQGMDSWEDFNAIFDGFLQTLTVNIPAS